MARQNIELVLSIGYGPTFIQITLISHPESIKGNCYWYLEHTGVKVHQSPSSLVTL